MVTPRPPVLLAARNGRGVYVGMQEDATKANSSDPQQGSKCRTRNTKAFRTTTFKRFAFGYSLNEKVGGREKAVKVGILDKYQSLHRAVALAEVIKQVEIIYRSIGDQVPGIADIIARTEEYLKGKPTRYCTPNPLLT